MKSVLSLLLVACLVISTVPLGAQARVEAASLDVRESTTQAPVAGARIPIVVPLGAILLEPSRELSPIFAKTSGSVAKGAIIGFAVGAVLGTTVGQEACLHSPRWHCAVGAGTMFAAIGGLIAWLH